MGHPYTSEAPLPRRRPLTAAMISLIAATALSGSASAAEKASHAEVVIEVPPGGPYPSEMLKLHVRSRIRGFVGREELRQPSLTDLDWKQLGPDVWSYVMEKGLRVNAFERTMAIYPQRAGRIEVPAFTHHLTLVDTDGIRSEMDLQTNALSLEVKPLPQGAADWWLPASSFSVTDSWDKRPDRLSLGDTARRTVTIDVVGVGSERLPPPPKMRAPGIISFAAPSERSSRVTADGPVSRIVYRWDVRPVSADAAVLPAVEIPWFDTVARRPRRAVIPETRISLASADLRDEATGKLVETPAFSFNGFLLAAAAAFAWGLTAIWLWRRISGENANHAALEQLRRAARTNDPKKFKTALLLLANGWEGALDPRLRAGMAQLDRHLFSLAGGPAPDLGLLYRALARLIRTQEIERAQHRTTSLLPLDGSL